MRKNENSVRLCGYVYDKSKLTIKESGPTSKNPGTVFISGDLDIAVDEDAINVIPVHFTYMTATYAKSGKANASFGILQKLLETPDNTWIDAGKEKAVKIQVDGALALNDFINNEDQRVSSKRVEGSFVSLVKELPDVAARNKFSVDIVISGVRRVEADAQKNIAKDYVELNGYAFNFRNDILPVTLSVRNEMAMKHFEDLGVTGANPEYTKLWGKVIHETVKVEKIEESDWGEAAVSVYERTNKDWVITGGAKVPYDFGDEKVMTADEIVTALQNREVAWAEIKKRNEEYQASKKAAPAQAAASPANMVKQGGFDATGFGGFGGFSNGF